MSEFTAVLNSAASSLKWATYRLGRKGKPELTQEQFVALRDVLIEVLPEIIKASKAYDDDGVRLATTKLADWIADQIAAAKESE